MTMASPMKKGPNHLSPLTTSWHNRSMSSISATSDAATFHSAHAHQLSSNSNMELHPLSQLQSQQSILSMTKPIPSPKLEAVKMNRQDSGYSDTPTPTSPVASSHRRSTSSARPRSPNKMKRRTTGSSATSASRPSTKRASRSSAQVRTSTGGGRPSMQLRHTVTGTSYSHTSHSHQPYQFFQFPTFSSPSATDDTLTPPPPPPPATVQYWTSDSTRRLEYAAIDAASKGVRGFLIKLVPDCILPKSSRRTKFCDGDEGSDAGSVRRYRLQLPEEKVCPLTSSREIGSGSRVKDGLMRRLSSFGKGSRVA